MWNEKQAPKESEERERSTNRRGDIIVGDSLSVRQVLIIRRFQERINVSMCIYVFFNICGTLGKVMGADIVCAAPLYSAETCQREKYESP